MRNWKLIVFVVLPLVVVAYLALWPVPIEPVAWEPPESPPLEGQYETNQKLKGAGKLLTDVGTGPEEVAPTEDGLLYTGLYDGRILRFDPDNPSDYEVRTQTERPLGMEVHPAGYLVYADAYDGLMRLNRNGRTINLTSEVNGRKLTLTNDVTIAPDGTIYFSESSTKFGLHELELDLLEHGGRGRILRYEPETREVSVEATGLVFANGVTMSHDGNAVLVSDLGNYRILRYPLREDGSLGDPSTVIDGLPGLPDNINQGREKGYWVALATPRNAMLDFMAPYPWLRKVVARLPRMLQPAAERHAIVLKISEEGDVLRNLQDTSGDVAKVSTAYPYGKYLYLGSYEEPSLRRYPLNKN